MTTESIEKIIPVIEKIFDIRLYEWQKQFLMDLPHVSPTGRRNGRTFIYCIKLCLSDGEPMDFRFNRSHDYVDEAHGPHYEGWFRRYFLDIHHALEEHGIPVRKVIVKSRTVNR